MTETLATCLCKQMLFCYLTNESLRHQRRQEKDNCLYTADPGAPLTYFNDGGVRQRFIFYTQKNPSVFLHQQILLFIFWEAKTC